MTALILAFEWLFASIITAAIMARAIPHTPDDLPRQHGEGEWVRGEDFNHTEGVY